MAGSRVDVFYCSTRVRHYARLVVLSSVLPLASASSVNSQRRCPTAMWHSWILAVLVDEIVIVKSASWASIPPSLPLNPMVVRRCLLAALIPSSTFGELPLVLMPNGDVPRTTERFELPGEYPIKTVIVTNSSENG